MRRYARDRARWRGTATAVASIVQYGKSDMYRGGQYTRTHADPYAREPGVAILK